MSSLPRARTQSEFEPRRSAIASTEQPPGRGASAADLLRRARRVAIGAEHAAIARLRPQPLAAGGADVEELAGVRRHLFSRLVRADRAGDHRPKLDGDHRASVLSFDAEHVPSPPAQPAKPRVRMLTGVLLSAQSDRPTAALVLATGRPQVRFAGMETPHADPIARTAPSSLLRVMHGRLTLASFVG
jgi:hypothetical protein